MGCGVISAGLLFIATEKVYINYALPVSVFAGIIVSLRFIEHKKPDKAGLAFRVKDLAYFLIGFAATAAFYSIAIAAESFVQGENLFPQYIVNIANGFGRSFLNVLFIPISEEMLCRGYILGNCFESMKRWQRSGIAALIFSLAHWGYVPGTGIYSYLLVNVISTFVIAIFLNNVRLVTGSIWCGVAIHWLYNYFGLCIFEDGNPTLVFIGVTIAVPLLLFFALEKLILKRGITFSES